MVDSNTRRKFETLVAAAFADGFLAEAEKEILKGKAEELGISPREMHETLGLGQQRKLSVSIPATTLEREKMLDDLIDVVSADGRVEPSEYSMLDPAASTGGGGSIVIRSNCCVVRSR